LKDGALLVDVRTPSEFNSGHLRDAINLPLDQIEVKLPRRAKDKNQAVLLHCQSVMQQRNRNEEIGESSLCQPFQPGFVRSGSTNRTPALNEFLMRDRAQGCVVSDDSSVFGCGGAMVA
jgi:hypothetical protein